MEKAKKYLCVVLLAVLAGCNLLENGFVGGKPRSFYERSDNEADSVKNVKSPQEPVSPRVIFDTTVFVSAVRCGPGYDWQKDTAYGCADAQLILYRNGEVKLCIPVGEGGVSAAPDMHHIIDGHLYTEYCDYSTTVIGCDGEELYSVSGRELLKGLLVKGADVYTLSEKLSTGGVVFRKNGEQVLYKSKAKVFGGFGDPSYGPNGALYEDAGSICFAYRVQAGCYIVRDGKLSMVPSNDATDAKSVGGKDVVVGLSTPGHSWKDARIWRLGEAYLVSGESADAGAQGLFKVVDEWDGHETVFKMRNAAIYCAEGVQRAVDIDEMNRRSFCFLPCCATLMDDNLATLCTPRDGGTPYLSVGGKKTYFEGLDGYLTGVTATISQTSTLP